MSKHRGRRGGRKRAALRADPGGFAVRGVSASELMRDAARRNIHIISQFILGDLTPERIQQVYRSAPGSIADQLMLAHEIEQKDDVLRGMLATRRKAVMRMGYKVESGDPGNPKADEAAEEAARVVYEPWYSQASEWLLTAIFKQYAACELIWDNVGGMWRVVRIRKVEPWRWNFDIVDDQVAAFFYTTPTRSRTERVRPVLGKYVYHSYDDNEIPGDFALFRAIMKWWYTANLSMIDRARMNQNFGIPTIKFTYEKGQSYDDVSKIVETMLSLAGNKIIAVPSGTEVETEDLPSQMPHKELREDYEKACARLILGQTKSSIDTGQANTGATLQAEVRDDYRDDDAAKLDVSFAVTFWKPWTRWNFGEGVPPPYVTRIPIRRRDPASRLAIFEGASRLGIPMYADEIYGDLNIERPVDESGDDLVPDVFIPRASAYDGSSLPLKSRSLLPRASSAVMNERLGSIAPALRGAIEAAARMNGERIKALRDAAMEIEHSGGDDGQKYDELVKAIARMVESYNPQEQAEMLYQAQRAALAVGAADADNNVRRHGI